MLAGRSGRERMDVCANREPECSKCNGDRDMQGGRPRRVLRPNALARDVRRVSNGAHDPRRQAPRLHLGVRDREQNANEGVPDTEKNGRTHPRLTKRLAHVCGQRQASPAALTIQASAVWCMPC